MQKNIQNVVTAFNAGRHHSEKNVSTDGRTIWSYAMPIVSKSPSGSSTIWVLNRGPSQTTNKHINQVMKGLDHLVPIQRVDAINFNSICGQ